MEGFTPIVNILERYSVSPPPDAVTVASLPLNFFDLLWVTFHPLGRVIFYDFPYPTTYFTQNIVPNLKTSFSLALKHFTPLAGNLLTPSDPDSKADFQIRYLDGDSVSVTFAECTGELNHFSGNHVRDAEILKPLLPQLKSAPGVDISGEKCLVSPVLAIQITVFPNKAICVGITNSHVVADGSSMFNFVKAWASIAKQVVISGDIPADISDLISSGCFQVPYYDRSLIKDPYDLGALLVKVLGPQVMQIEQFHKGIVQDFENIKHRATFVITEANTQALKKIVTTTRPTSTHVTSFTVVCAYLWTCFAKTRATVWKEVHNLDENQSFGFAMDARARLIPPLPASYFGNCLVPCLAVQTGRVMVGDEGLVSAAESLGNTISVKVNSKEGALHGADKWVDDFAGLMRGEWNIGIAGSPKLDYYNNIDFGWGKPLKFDFVQEPLSMSRCKDSKTDIEIGIILPKNEMDVFSTVFTQGLHSLQGS